MGSSVAWQDEIWSRSPATPVADPEPIIRDAHWWDIDRTCGNAALRSKEGRVLLVVVRDGISWGVYQMQRYGQASDTGEWELLQIRGTHTEALRCAEEMAARAGLI